MEKSLTNVETLFGKPIEKIKCEDIKGLIDGEVSESLFLEYKQGNIDLSKLKNLILKTIIGFLNSSAGEGILIIGISEKDGKPDKIVVIPKENLPKNHRGIENKIREWILSSVETVPKSPIPPIINIKIFDTRKDCKVKEDGLIISIHIKRTYNTVYYNKNAGITYMRRANKTVPLTLKETLSLIEKKRVPIIIPGVKITNIKKVGNYTYNIILDIWADNYGSRPANTCAMTLYIFDKKWKKYFENKALCENIQLHHQILKVTGSKVLSITRKGNSWKIVTYNNAVYKYYIPVFPDTGLHLATINMQLRLKKKTNDPIVVPIKITTYTESTKTLMESIYTLKPMRRKHREIYETSEKYSAKTIEYTTNKIIYRKNK